RCSSPPTARVLQPNPTGLLRYEQHSVAVVEHGTDRVAHRGLHQDIDPSLAQLDLGAVAVEDDRSLVADGDRDCLALAEKWTVCLRVVAHGGTLDGALAPVALDGERFELSKPVTNDEVIALCKA